MKKLALILVSLLLLVLTVRTSWAQDENAPFRVRSEKVEEKREVVREKVSERKENVLERRKTNLAKFLQNMVTRLRAYVVRLETLITRIESRVDKIAEESPETNLTGIKASVTEAKTLLATTKDKIAELEG